MMNRSVSYVQAVIHLVIFVGFYFLSAIVSLIVLDGIHIMMIWNAFLAFIPVFIVYLFERFKKSKIWSLVLFLSWFFFYPNSLYLVTDLIYLSKDNYMVDTGYTLSYLQDIPSYLAYFHLFIGAMLGIMTAFFSFDYFYEEFKIRFKKFRHLYFIFIPLISSIGIYIGRFLRYNSWDLLNVFGIVKDFFRGFSWFSLLYIGIFMMIQYLVFGYIYLSRRIKKGLEKI
ncbi:MAG: DUF1361 domain-containing protein [Candidatus Izemoplasmatales bacterium]|nr:DUF1361 domain-containing protein [Candidatus Izemoplasmatales bacterium]